MAGIWQKLLGMEKISIHDDYFELGGDSLLAIQLIAKLYQIFLNKITSKYFTKLAQSIKNPSLFETQLFVLVKIQTGIVTFL
ncbi:MAG: phosphopantetheine-binding protein [Candidatus Marithrix sp.]